MGGAKAMSAGGGFSAIASKTGQKPKDVKAVFTALNGIATSEVAKTEKFAIEGGEGLPRLGPQEGHLRIVPGEGVALRRLRWRCPWSCHGCTVHGRRAACTTSCRT